MNIEWAKKSLKDAREGAKGTVSYYMGIPIEKFDRDDLLGMIAMLGKQIDDMRKNQEFLNELWWK